MVNMEINGELVPLAQPHAVNINVPLDVLHNKFTTYWDEVKDRLSPELLKKARKGYRTVDQHRVVKASGGQSIFYRPVLIGLVEQFMDTKDYNLMALQDVVLHTTPEDARIQALLYLEPSVTWRELPGADNKINVTMQASSGVANEEVDSIIERFRLSQTILNPVENGVLAAEGHVVAVDGESYIDGKRWEPGCFTNNRWVLDRTVFKMPTMVDKVLGASVGLAVTWSQQLSAEYGVDSNKSVDITLHINQIYTKEVPAVDDDLAVSAGHVNLTSWKSSLTTQVQARQESTRRELIEAQVINKLIESSSVGPIPHIWIQWKSSDIYTEQRNLVKTEEELFNKFSSVVTNASKESLLLYFNQVAIQVLVKDLVVRSWGKMMKVDGDTRFKNLAEYAKQVRSTIMDSYVEVVEAPVENKEI